MAPVLYQGRIKRVLVNDYFYISRIWIFVFKEKTVLTGAIRFCLHAAVNKRMRRNSKMKTACSYTSQRHHL